VTGYSLFCEQPPAADASHQNIGQMEDISGFADQGLCPWTPDGVPPLS
jgi:hypothetical protein